MRNGIKRLVELEEFDNQANKKPDISSINAIEAQGQAATTETVEAPTLDSEQATESEAIAVTPEQATENEAVAVEPEQTTETEIVAVEPEQTTETEIVAVEPEQTTETEVVAVEPEQTTETEVVAVEPEQVTEEQILAIDTEQTETEVAAIAPSPALPVIETEQVTDDSEKVEEIPMTTAQNEATTQQAETSQAVVQNTPEQVDLQVETQEQSNRTIAQVETQPVEPQMAEDNQLQQDQVQQQLVEQSLATPAEMKTETPVVTSSITGQQYSADTIKNSETLPEASNTITTTQAVTTSTNISNEPAISNEVVPAVENKQQTFVEQVSQESVQTTEQLSLPAVTSTTVQPAVITAPPSLASSEIANSIQASVIDENPQTVTQTTTQVPVIIEQQAESSWMPYLFDIAIICIILFIANSIQKSIKQLAKDVAEITENQKQILAKQEVESDSAARMSIIINTRQQWCETLRTDVGNFIGCANAMWDLQRIILEKENSDKEEDKTQDWVSLYNKMQQEAEALCAKINLSIDPEDSLSGELSSGIDKVMLALAAKKSPAKLNDELIEISRAILTQESQELEKLAR